MFGDLVVWDTGYRDTHWFGKESEKAKRGRESESEKEKLGIEQQPLEATRTLPLKPKTLKYLANQTRSHL